MSNLSKILCCGLVCLVGTGVQCMQSPYVSEEVMAFRNRTLVSFPGDAHLRVGWSMVETLVKHKPSNDEQLNDILVAFQLKNIDCDVEMNGEGQLAEDRFMMVDKKQRLEGNEFWLEFNYALGPSTKRRGFIRVKTDDKRNEVWMHNGFEYKPVEGYFKYILKDILTKNEGTHSWPFDQAEGANE